MFMFVGGTMASMQPFTDVDVLDLTQSIAGPFATQQLGALGANVVKVEPPRGDDFRGKMNGAMFAAYNMGGKRSLCLDLKTEAGRGIVRELASKADVLVESFRPGVMERFGLDYESVAADNEDIVYCSVTGFGSSGPYSDRPAYDPVLQAMSGLMSLTGYPDRPPVRAGSSIVDCGTGMTASFGIAAALLERERTGEGDHVEVALYEVAVTWMAYWLANYDATGETPQRARPGGFASLAPYGVFEAGDDDQLYLSVVNDEQFQRLCDAFDLDELAADERFRTTSGRWDHRDELYDAVSAAFDEYDRETLVERLVGAGVPAGPLQDLAEVAADAHLAERNMFTDVENVHTGETIETPGIPLTTSDGRPDPDGHPPALGEHTRSLLADMGYSEDRIDRLVEDGVVSDR
jgi:crotonobetainyl-CoA:carnitine CoA-transferase CaiB-like acyl-CoA transferase